jgi:hypothetical protein
MGVTLASDGTIYGTLSSHTRKVQLRLMKEKNADRGERLLLIVLVVMLLVVLAVLFVIKFLRV